MINDGIAPPDTNASPADEQPLATFPELGEQFSTLPDTRAEAVLSACLSRLQQLPVDESSPAWASRLGLTLRLLLTAVQFQSPEVQDSLAKQLANWTLQRFLRCDTIAAEIVVALAQHQPRALAVAGQAIVKSLVQGLQQQALPAWTATLIGLLRQAANEPSAATRVQAALVALPDWHYLLRREAVEQALASNDPNALSRLVGHFSLLSLLDLAQMPGQPLSLVLPPKATAPTIAPAMQPAVERCLADATVRLPWVLTPSATEAIDALMARLGALFPSLDGERLRQELVLSVARAAAIQQAALQGPEAVLLIGLLQRLMRAAPDGDTPAAWAPVWRAVRQLAGQAKPHPSLATPATDRSRTVNTLLCPRGLAGRLEAVGWRVALLRQSGLPLIDFLGQLVQQVPCSPSGQPLLARVLQIACASPGEHEQALLEMSRVEDAPPYACAARYTQHLLLAARSTQRSGEHDEATLRRVAAELPPGLLTLGLIGHWHRELPGQPLSPDGAAWLVERLQTSVAGLAPDVPMGWVLQVCTPLTDALFTTPNQEQKSQWMAWLRTL